MQVAVEVLGWDAVLCAGAEDGFDGPAGDGVGGVFRQPVARAGFEEGSELPGRVSFCFVRLFFLMGAGLRIGNSE